MDNEIMEQFDELSQSDLDQLEHWGIKGMKWGIRRYQTKDGSLTPEGRKRYNDDVAKLKAKNAKLDNKLKAKAARDKAKARVEKLLAENKAKKAALKGDGDDVASKLSKKAAKAAKKAEEKLKAKEKKEREIEESLDAKNEAMAKNKEKILRSQDPKKVLENAHLFSTKELQDAYIRLGVEKNIKGLVPEEVSKGMQMLNKTVDVTQKMSSIATNVGGIYDKAAGLINALPDSAKARFGLDGKELPTISGFENYKKRQAEAAKKAEEEASRKAKKDRSDYIDSLTREEAIKKFGTFTSDEISRMSKRWGVEDTTKTNAEKYANAKRKADDRSREITKQQETIRTDLEKAKNNRTKAIGIISRLYSQLENTSSPAEYKSIEARIARAKAEAEKQRGIVEEHEYQISKLEDERRHLIY